MLRFRIVSRLGCIAAAALFAVAAHAGASTPSSLKTEHLQVELVSDISSVKKTGQNFQLGVHFKLEAGWHIYWKNAGDSGQPPRVQWSLPTWMPADSIGPLRFPVPQRLPLGPLMDFGYQGEVLFPFAVHFQPTENVKESALPITANLRWLVCREVCIPGKGTVSLTLPLQTAAGSADPQTVAMFAHAAAMLPKPLPSDARVEVKQDAARFIVTVHGLPSENSVEFFPADQNIIANAAPQKVTSRADGFHIVLQKDATAGTVTQLQGVLRMPDGTGYVFAAPVQSAAVAGTKAAEQGIARIALLAFLGGIILNLMPCVFPVLFMKGLALVQSATEERKRLRAHGAMYALGILVSFWAMVAVLLTLRAGGSHIGWGFQFQSPIFVSSIALLLFFLGLSLAGQFEIGLSLTNKGEALTRKSGYTGSFFTGVLATVVATPCAAPFLGVAIGYALVQPALVTFTIFTALALGLAAPYVLLTLQPAWTRFLPKPGVWMEYLKQATAIPIFATVSWLGWVFAQVAGLNAVVFLLAAFLLTAIAGWALGRWPARATSTVIATILIMLAVAMPIVAAKKIGIPSRGENAGQASGLVWQPYDAAKLAEARAQGKNVFVDFTAAWCLSCQVNERVVLDRADVQDAFKKSGVILMRADWTNHDDAISEALAELGRSSVPTYVFYDGENAPRLLPEVLTTGIVMDALQKVPQAGK